MIAALHPQFWWWVARSTGIVAWAMATASVAWGLTLSGRLVRQRRLPAWLLDLHRYLGTLTLAFVAVHLAALVADSYVVFGAADLFVPMASRWRPGAVTWGVFAFYGLVIIQVTSWGMRRLPRGVWHGIHLSSYVVFVAATLHGALAGADRDNPVLQMVAVAGMTLVGTLTVLRVLARRPDEGAARPEPSGAGPTTRRNERTIDACAPTSTARDAARGRPAGDRAAKIAAARAAIRARAEPASLPRPTGPNGSPGPSPMPLWTQKATSRRG